MVLILNVIQINNCKIFQFLHAIIRWVKYLNKWFEYQYFCFLKQFKIIVYTYVRVYGFPFEVLKLYTSVVKTFNPKIRTKKTNFPAELILYNISEITSVIHPILYVNTYKRKNVVDGAKKKIKKQPLLEFHQNIGTYVNLSDYPNMIKWVECQLKYYIKRLGIRQIIAEKNLQQKCFQNTSLRNLFIIQNILRMII